MKIKNSMKTLLLRGGPMSSKQLLHCNIENKQISEFFSLKTQEICDTMSLTKMIKNAGQVCWPCFSLETFSKCSSWGLGLLKAGASPWGEGESNRPFDGHQDGRMDWDLGEPPTAGVCPLRHLLSIKATEGRGRDWEDKVKPFRVLLCLKNKVLRKKSPQETWQVSFCWRLELQGHWV